MCFHLFIILIIIIIYQIQFCFNFDDHDQLFCVSKNYKNHKKIEYEWLKRISQQDALSNVESVFNSEILDEQNNYVKPQIKTNFYLKWLKNKYQIDSTFSHKKTMKTRTARTHQFETDTPAMNAVLSVTATDVPSGVVAAANIDSDDAKYNKNNDIRNTSQSKEPPKAMKKLTMTVNDETQTTSKTSMTNKCDVVKEYVSMIYDCLIPNISMSFYIIQIYVYIVIYFPCLVVISVFIYYIGQINPHVVELDFDTVFLIVMIVFAVLKWFIKRIARIIDTFKIAFPQSFIYFENMYNSTKLVTVNNTSNNVNDYTNNNNNNDSDNDNEINITRIRLSVVIPSNNNGSKNVDSNNINNNTNFNSDENNNASMSLEYFSEFLLSYLYWDSYRYLFICQNIKLSSFIISSILHIMSETFVIIARTSDYYINTSINIQNNSKYKHFRKKNRCLSFVLPVATSNDIQWRNRISIDLMAHFNSSTMVGLFWLINIIVQQDVYKDIGINVNQSFVYLFVSIMIDLSIFTFYAIWFYIKYDKMLIITPFVSIYKLNKWKYVWSVAVVGAVYGQQWFYYGLDPDTV